MADSMADSVVDYVADSMLELFVNLHRSPSKPFSRLTLPWIPPRVENGLGDPRRGPGRASMTFTGFVIGYPIGYAHKTPGKTILPEVATRSLHAEPAGGNS